jgi:Transposase DDE domain
VACAVTNDPGDRDWLSPLALQAKDVLACRFDTVEFGRHIRYDATSACTGWAFKPQGTRHTGGRRMTRGGDEPLLEEMEPRVRSRPEVMKRRKALVEPPVGTMKRWWDAGYFLMRGLEQVRTECSVTVLADNLRRVLNLVEMPQLLAALGCEVPVRSFVVRAASPWKASGCRKQGETFSGGF